MIDSCSLRSRIAALEVGESASESQRYALGFVTADDMRKGVEKLRNAANPGVQFAKSKNPDADYTVESGDYRTKSFDVIATVCITRTK